MKRRHRPVSHVSHERWLVSYADFITLLFAFFTTMYAVSTVDSMKLHAVVESMQAAFATGEASSPNPGPGPGTGATPQRLNIPAQPKIRKPGERGGKKPGDDRNTAAAVSVQEVKAKLELRLDRQIEGGLVALEVDPRGLVVSIREAGSFPTGSADLSGVLLVVLQEIAGALAEVGNAVRVEGHTDDVPIHTARFQSNWELSTARATSVVAQLLHDGLQPERLSAAGYGEFHPQVSNDSAPNRARNRRTDIVVLNPLTNAREEPAQTVAVGDARRD
jgi:chemotaxis protein MotB